MFGTAWFVGITMGVKEDEAAKVNAVGDKIRELKAAKAEKDVIMAEVEKIWIIYDCDDSKCLEFEEIKQYLTHMTKPRLLFSEE